MYRRSWRLPLAVLVAFSHLQFSQIRGRQPYLIVRKIPYLINKVTAHLEFPMTDSAALGDKTVGDHVLVYDFRNNHIAFEIKVPHARASGIDLAETAAVKIGREVF